MAENSLGGLMKKLTALLTLVPMLLACGGTSSSETTSKQSEASSAADTSSVDAGSSSSTQQAFSEKQINVYYIDTDLNQTTKLRFYDDSPSIPYMGIDQYFSLLLKGRSEDENLTTLEVEYADGQYTVVTPSLHKSL